MIPKHARIAESINEWAGDKLVGFKSLEEVEPTKK